MSKDIKNMHKAETTIKGQLTQIRKNTRSTTTNKNIENQHTNTDTIKEQNNIKTDLVMATVDGAHKIYTDHMEKLSIHPVKATSMY